jgi:hypothetical protein
MVCPNCKSDDLSVIPAEIRLYRNAPRTLSHPPMSPSPDVHVCLDCGWSGFSIPTSWVSAWLRPLQPKVAASVPTLVAEVTEISDARRKTA